MNRPPSRSGAAHSEYLPLDAVERLIDLWRAVDWRGLGPIDACATPLGIRPWARHFGDDSFGLYIADGGPSARDVLPVSRHRRSVAGLAIRVLASPGNFYWQFGYTIALGDVPASTEALLRGLRRRRDWDVLRLGPMLASSAHADACVASGERLQMHPAVHGRKVDPIVRVEGSWRDFYATRSQGLQDKIAQGERRLMRLGALELDEYRGGPELVDRLTEFYALEAGGWKGRAGTAIAGLASVESFYTDLAHEAAALGQFRLYGLRVAGRLVASDFTVLCGGVLALLKIAYDEGHKRSSPGHVLRKMVLQRLFETREAAIYDLMTGGGDHAGYKQRWSNASREYVVVQLHNPATVRGQLARAALASRRLVKRLAAPGQRPS